MGNNAGKAQASVNGANIAGSAVVSDGAFHHYALSDNGSNSTTFYLDGVSQGSLSQAIPRNAYQVMLRNFAYNNTPYPLDGALDEVAIFSTTAQRYTVNFTPPASAYTGNEPGLVALYHFDASGQALI